MFDIRPLADDEAAALEAAFSAAPYLRRLSEQTPDAFDRIRRDGAPAVFEAAMEATRLAAGAGLQAAETGLRRAKRAAHLAIAGADLSGRWSLEEVTGAITRFADAAVEAALAAALAKRGLAGDGLFAIALGKMGAFELNYSSDIDFCVFYDPDLFKGGERGPADAASRVVRDATRLLEERTGEGYVFRTDLRLRPDPSSTPPAVSTRMAELYYESVGQNWERMVWIKARPCAGDFAAAAVFLGALRPFVWRRHLDYWAIADIHAIKRMINDSSGAAELETDAPDLKLGPGGVREIEFFAQTQQVILGGRNVALRQRATVPALAALAEAGAVDRADADWLTRAYRVLRHLEHRIQMRADEQTHALPDSEDARAAVAALCGADDVAALDDGLREIRRGVHRRYLDLFADEERRAADPRQGNFVFTGVDDDPGTVATLSRLGFADPPAVIERVRRWHRGGTPATRTSRGRELLTALLPDLLSAMAATGEPDTAFSRFGSFLEGLPSGVQCLSMLLAEPELMRDLVVTLGLAPRLSVILAKRPDLLEALLDTAAEPDPVDPEADFETAMNQARRLMREEMFVTGHRLLHGRIEARQAAEAWTALADRSVRAMASAAEAETARRYGSPPGAWAVMAMGRLGGRDMTAGSDLDLMVLYEPAEQDGDAQTWFSRFTQRLITALSAPTAEGLLYEVDMRLRPSGRAGPVAVRFAAFERYQREEAWTWEHMALTRIRPVAGEAALGRRVLQTARAVIETAADDPDAITKDVADMRERLFRDKPAAGSWDLKLVPGGLVDVEFIVQNEILIAGDADLVVGHTGEAIETLAKAGRLARDEAVLLSRALSFEAALMQVLRVAVEGVFKPDAASAALKDRLCRAVGLETFDDVEAQLAGHLDGVAQLRAKKLRMRATES